MKSLHWEELDLHLRNISGPWLSSAQGKSSWIPLWNEVCLALKGKFPENAAPEASPWEGPAGKVLAMGLWLLTHRELRDLQNLENCFASFRTWAVEACTQVNAELFLTDGERREELIRRLLAACEILVEGEDPSRSAERLEVLDSLARARILQEARTAQKRAKEIREALARKEAEEAASKYTRE